MKMLGGSYGEGSLFFSPYSSELKISPNKGWKTHVFPIDEITAYEEVGVATSSSLGKAGVGAAAGFLLAGPLAGLAGMAWGASSGSTNSFTFGLGFHNGNSILVNASAKDYAEFKAAIGNLSFFKKTLTASRQKNQKTQTKTTRKTKSSNKPQVIEGRSREKAPIPKTPIAVECRQLEEKSASGSDKKIFYGEVNTRVNQLNTIKWRHFDKLVSDDEVKECICMAVQDQASYFSGNGDYYRKQAIQTRNDAGLFGKAKAEAKAQEYERQAVKDDAKAENDRRLTLLFTSLAKTHVDEEHLSDGLKRSKDHVSVTKAYAFRIIERFREEEPVNDDLESVAIVHPKSESSTDKKFTPEERLEKLSSLKEKGLITEDEYKEQRAAIISQI